MKEYITDALVLDTENAGDLDKLIYLYAPNLGKIVAKAKSARKITSKLSGQLQPLCLTKVRLVEKNGIQVTDAILLRRVEKSEAAVSLALFIKEMTPEFQPDRKLWLLIKNGLDDIKNKKFSYKPLLETLGFAPKFATCSICRGKNVKFFSMKEQLFFCNQCALKIPKNELILIE